MIAICLIIGIVEIYGFVYLIKRDINQDVFPYIQKCCHTYFPQSITDIKAETITKDIFEETTYFILRFQADANEVNDFLLRLGKTSENFAPYTPGLDKRFRYKYPEWFQSPIKTGQAGIIDIHEKTLDIYVDTGHENVSVVYMEGIYYRR